MNQLGGRIFVSSEANKGTIFNIYLPTLREEMEVKAKSRLRVKETASRGDETILIVDDEVTICKLLVTILSGLGYTVLSASTAEEAVQNAHLHKSMIDLLLTDVVLPDKTGPELARELREQNREMKVLFMSGYADERMVHSDIPKSQNHFVSKPFRPTIIAKKVREILNSSPTDGAPSAIEV